MSTVVRFAVGNPDRRHSSTWRIWSNPKGDFYVATRSLGGIVKVSFHKDGNCFAGFTSEYAAKPDSKAPQDRSRHWEQWKLPEGPCSALKILIPEEEMRFFPPRSTGKTLWLDAPGAGELFVATIFIAPTGTKTPTLAEADAAIIDVLPTKIRTAFVVGLSHPMNEQTVARVESERRKLHAVSPHRKDVGRRAAAFGGNTRPDGTRYFLEMAWQDA